MADKHEFDSDLDTFKHWMYWMADNPTISDEEKADYKDTAQSHPDKWERRYIEWLIDQKITHTITREDGTEEVQKYTDYL